MDLIWLKFLMAPVLIVVPIWLGKRIGIWYKKKMAGAEIAPLISVVGATLGYFAFMLAVTYQMTSTRFQARKDLLLDDVSAISAANMQIGLLEDSYQITCRKLILKYVDLLILVPSEKGDNIKVGVDRAKQTLDSLWLQAKTMSRENKAQGTAFASTVINLKQQFTRRVTVGIYSGIPVAIMVVLYLVACFTMLLVGFQFGISGKSSVLPTLVLAITFSSVMWLIFALDHPETGIIKLDQQPMIELQKEITRSF